MLQPTPAADPDADPGGGDGEPTVTGTFSCHPAVAGTFFV